MLYHIATLADWNAHAHQDTYTPQGFYQEGFIHLSTHAQVAGVLQRYYKGREDLLQLHIDERALTAVLKYEPSTGNELFPHLYGQLNKSAVMQIEQLPRVQ